MRLYHEAKRLGAWDPRALALDQDARDWARFTVTERDVLLRLTALFQAAEESMTRDLLPLLMTVVREDRLEEELFLTTFLSEEAKHTEFFRRILDEVCRQSGDLERYQTPSFRKLFSEKLPAAMRGLLADASPAAQAQALVTYTLVGEGVLGEAGYHVFNTALEGGGRGVGGEDALARLGLGTVLVGRGDGEHRLHAGERAVDRGAVLQVALRELDAEGSERLRGRRGDVAREGANAMPLFDELPGDGSSLGSGRAGHEYVEWLGHEASWY